jgi:hypothetical protein
MSLAKRKDEKWWMTFLRKPVGKNKRYGFSDFMNKK